MVTPTIPISQVVDIVPGVVGTGGNPLSLNAVIVSDNVDMVSTSELKEFYDADGVAAYFGSDSVERTLAAHYFLGYDNSFKKPGALYFAGYANAATPAWLRGVRVSGLTVPQLQEIAGEMTVTISGTPYSGIVDFSEVTSFQGGALKLAEDLELTGVATVVWDAFHGCYVIKTVATGVTATIERPLGAVADILGLSSGGVSNGVVADTPFSAMDRIKQQGNNWATFFTTFRPDIPPDTASLMTGFAAWSNSQSDEYLYIGWDNAAGYAIPNNPLVFGSEVAGTKLSGTYVIYGEAIHAAASAGYVAAIDFQAVNGRATAAFKSQEGLPTSVNTLALAQAVLSNGASYYGRYGARGGNLDNCFYNGQMPGSKFQWVDTYVNQIYLNSQLRLGIWYGLRAVNYAPYNAYGETLLRSWCADPIAEALNNGTIQTGVTLSSSQKSTIAQQAGLDISNELFAQGYYLQILPATAQVRGQRQSPPCKLWYCDGGSIQSVVLPSIAIL